MTIQFLVRKARGQYSIKENSLIVCAGTITCKNVSQMGSGFWLFKTLFSEDVHYTGKLNTLLNAYHNEDAPMPFYITVAQQDGFLGGVATVPSYRDQKDLKVNNLSYSQQYVLAVKNAILEALKLKRPLFIQPLGIGAYQWDPAVAAANFAQAIAEADPEGKVDITIPLYNMQKDSPDWIFALALSKCNGVRSEWKIPDQESIVRDDDSHGGMQVDSDDDDIPEAVNTLNNIAPTLITIIDCLIDNIEKKKNGRKTSGTNSPKVTQLKQAKKYLSENPVAKGSDGAQEVLEHLTNICKEKRNAIHFWGTPHSLKELHQLLVLHEIENSNPHSKKFTPI